MVYTLSKEPSIHSGHFPVILQKASEKFIEDFVPENASKSTDMYCGIIILKPSFVLLNCRCNVLSDIKLNYIYEKRYSSY